MEFEQTVRRRTINTSSVHLNINGLLLYYVYTKYCLFDRLKYLNAAKVQQIRESLF